MYDAPHSESSTTETQQINTTHPIQKILFGSPGTGKSYRIDREIIPKDLKIDETINPESIIKTVFHPEYTYGDFMGKLVPITKGRSVRYKFYEGHFLKALSQAYKNILSHYIAPTKSKELKELSDKNKDFEINRAREIACNQASNVALVIDEINRGNSSAIFGTVFQLLDRDDSGWSSYGINITEIELSTLLSLIGVEEKALEGDQFEYKFPGESDWVKNYTTFQNRVDGLKLNLKDRKIWLPPNLSIIATMNTSDNSIYFMDSAFKRRWDWEFVDWDDSKPPTPTYGEHGILTEEQWKKLIRNFNSFIKTHHASIRGIEDKQVGYFFIKQPVTSAKIQNKLMFFAWDSVFNRDKKPLADLLGVKRDQLVTFGDFTLLHNNFVHSLMNWTETAANSNSNSETNFSP
ncbi:restriction endonuclease [Oscillatoria sp. FACHB-1406]|uniref:restriction endonuclease n=1 Tax=Oscillatoria sp. FACHB-1406 TaxID=2692846 RepID=UPI0018F05A7D|nr:restriction endonuclease [Oscillatoria sp. FACHB-1406]